MYVIDPAKGPGACPTFTFYYQELDQCRSLYCPDDHRRSEEGKCKQCGPYELGGETTGQCHFLKLIRGTYLKTSGYGKMCDYVAKGEPDTFIDELG